MTQALTRLEEMERINRSLDENAERSSVEMAELRALADDTLSHLDEVVTAHNAYHSGPNGKNPSSAERNIPFPWALALGFTALGITLGFLFWGLR